MNLPQTTRVIVCAAIVALCAAGEERGLLGSYHFTVKPIVPLDKIVAHFNIDMIGRTRNGEATAANEGLAGPDEVFVVGPRSLGTSLWYRLTPSTARI